MISNILIVEFSLKREVYYDINPNLRIILDSEKRKDWFEFRAEIFNKGLWACVQNQSKKPDAIYLLMDTDDEKYYKEYINHKEISPIYSPDISNCFTQIKLSLLKRDLYQNINISRIDSDDLVCKNYFEKINNQIQKHPCKYLLVCRGHICDLKNIQHIFHPGSSCVTLHIDQLQSKELFLKNNSVNLWRIPHTDYRLIPHTENHDAEFIRLIHKTNVTNSFVDINTNSNSDVWMFVSPIFQLDSDWFKDWAGFDVPDIKFEQFKFAGMM